MLSDYFSWYIRHIELMSINLNLITIHRRKYKNKYTSTLSWRGFIFTAVCLCVSVSLSCLCVRLCLWTTFQQNGCTALDAVFAKWLLATLARPLLHLVTLCQRSRSQWLNINNSLLTSLLHNIIFIILSLLSYVRSNWNSVCRLHMLFADLYVNFIKI